MACQTSHSQNKTKPTTKFINQELLNNFFLLINWIETFKFKIILFLHCSESTLLFYLKFLLMYFLCKTFNGTFFQIFILKYVNRHSLKAFLFYERKIKIIKNKNLMLSMLWFVLDAIQIGFLEHLLSQFLALWFCLFNIQIYIIYYYIFSKSVNC